MAVLTETAPADFTSKRPLTHVVDQMTVMGEAFSTQLTGEGSLAWVSHELSKSFLGGNFPHTSCTWRAACLSVSSCEQLKSYSGWNVHDKSYIKKAFRPCESWREPSESFLDGNAFHKICRGRASRPCEFSMWHFKALLWVEHLSPNLHVNGLWPLWVIRWVSEFQRRKLRPHVLQVKGLSFVWVVMWFSK